MDNSKIAILIIGLSIVVGGLVIYGLATRHTESDRLHELSPEARVLVEHMASNGAGSQERKDYALANSTVTIHDSGQWTPDNEFTRPESGYYFYFVDASISNDGDGFYNLNVTLQCKLRDAHGREYDQAMFGPKPRLKSREMPSGSTARGFLCFEVPESARPTEFVWAGLETPL